MIKNNKYNLFLVLLLAVISFILVYFKVKKDVNEGINEKYSLYKSEMETHLGQSWVSGALKLRITYSAEKQLEVFSREFFEKASISKNNEIIGGFGNIVADEVLRPGFNHGSFEEKGKIYFRSFIDDEHKVTFTLNKNYLKYLYPVISNIGLENNKLIVSTEPSSFLTWYFLSDYLRYFLGSLFTVFITIFFTSKYLRNKHDKETNERNVHDMREMHFLLRHASYWFGKYIKNPSNLNRSKSRKELDDINTSTEINDRIFANGKEIQDVKSFDISSEVKKIASFVAQTTCISQVEFKIPTYPVLIEYDLNAFTVLFLNLLKNAIDAVDKNPEGIVNIKLKVLNEHLELWVINDGKIKNIKKIMKNRYSESGSTGIGLSIVKKAEKVLGIKLNFQNHQSKVMFSASFKRNNI